MSNTHDCESYAHATAALHGIQEGAQLAARSDDKTRTEREIRRSNRLYRLNRYGNPWRQP